MILRRARLRRWMFALLGAVVVLSSACGGGDDDSAAASYEESSRLEGAYDLAGGDAPEAPADASAAFVDEETADGAPGSGGVGMSLGAPTIVAPAELGRDIAYTAEVAVETDDVAAAGREALAIVEDLGGIVFAQSTRTEPLPRVELTVKVLPADFAAALERLAGLGELVDQTISADDVTERIVDIESRISTAEASVVRLRALLEEAKELEGVAEIEGSLLERETTLETLRGQLRTLRGRVDLATITLRISQSPEVLAETGIKVTAWASDDADDPCLGRQHLAVEPDSTLYFCLEVDNVGASALTDVTVRSQSVRLNVDSFETLQGSFDRIESGGLLVAVLEEQMEDGRLAGRVSTRGLDVSFEVSAVPVDSAGTALHRVSAGSSVLVQARIHDSLPGFLDSIGEGVGFLRSAVAVVLVVAGVLVPFLPFVAVIAALAWWALRRRRLSRTT